NDDAGCEVRARLRSARETRQLGERDIHAKCCRLTTITLHPGAKVLWKHLSLEQAEEEKLWIDVRGDDRSVEDAPIREPSTRGASDRQMVCRAGLLRRIVRENRGDRRLGQDADTEPLRLACHGLRDRAHPADRMAPEPALAVDLAPGMVQQHVRARRGIGALESAYDGIESMQRLQRVPFEPAIEHVAGAAREELVQRALRLEGEAAEGSPECEQTPKVARAVEACGRSLEEQTAQGIGSMTEHRMKGRQALGVARGVLLQRGERVFECRSGAEGAAIGQ